MPWVEISLIKKVDILVRVAYIFGCRSPEYANAPNETVYTVSPGPCCMLILPERCEFGRIR